MGVAPDRILPLIDLIYDAALDEGLWAGLAPEVAAAFESSSTQISVQNRAHGHVHRLSQTANYTPALITDHREYYYKLDIWVRRAQELGLSRILMSKDLVDDDVFERSEFFQDFARKLGIFYIVGTVFPVASDAVGVLGIHRPKRQGAYDENDRRVAGILFSHLRKALTIRQSLIAGRAKRQAPVDALERMSIAALVVTDDATILYANAKAEEMLRAETAICMTNGKLAVRTRATSERLGLLIAEAAAIASNELKPATGALTIPREGRLPVTVLVAPLRDQDRSWTGTAQHALLLIRDPEHSAANTLALQSLLGLTPSEAAIVSALTRGRSLDGIAGELHISLNTVRTHLKHIFQKTGQRSQLDLVRFVLTSVAELR